MGAGARRAAGVARPVLGTHRHRRRRRRRGPAGDPLEPVPDGPGLGPDRRARHRRQGGHGQRLRRSLLLGHRGLHGAAAGVHQPRRRPRPAPLPPPHPSLGAPTGDRDVAARGVVPVADDQRRGGLGVLPGGHRPVPHRRRRRPRHRPLRHRHRRHRVPLRRGRRDPRRDWPGCSPTSGSTTTPIRPCSTSTG